MQKNIYSYSWWPTINHREETLYKILFTLHINMNPVPLCSICIQYIFDLKKYIYLIKKIKHFFTNKKNRLK